MVRHTLVIRGTMVFALWFAMTTVIGSLVPALALAQAVDSTDFESPIIEHEERDGGPLGAVEVFGATVVDNERIDDVTLHYRFNGQSDFMELPMKEIGTSSFYSARVDTAEIPEGTDSIEYYIRAEDASGNLTLRGFAFQPLQRPFQIAAPVTELLSAPRSDTTPAVIVQEADSSRVNWLYVALGVLVVGGIAAAAGGGGSDSGTTQTTDDCATGCDFTLTVERP